LVAYKDRRFFVTAKHCLKSQDRDPNSIRIEIDANSGVFDAFHRLYLPEGTEEWKDLAIYEFDPKVNPPAKLNSKDFLELDLFARVPFDISSGSRFAIRAYPTDLNAPDFDARILKHTSVSLSAGWDGRWSSPNCGGLQIDASLDELHKMGLTDLDGASGAPVFEIRTVPGGQMAVFRGVIVQGAMRMQRFIGAPVVFTALDKAVN